MGDKVLGALMAYFVLLLLFSLFVSLFARNKKIIYAFCIFLLVWYIVSATFFNFYESSFFEKEALMRELLLVVVLVVPSLFSTLIW
jgi:hypothetical protein